MTELQQPRIQQLSANHYHCDDLPALHQWLETHAYRYYGQHAANEYGRFSYQDSRSVGEQPRYVHSFIQVLESGEIYAPDPHAHALFAQLLPR